MTGEWVIYTTLHSETVTGRAGHREAFNDERKALQRYGELVKEYTKTLPGSGHWACLDLEQRHAPENRSTRSRRRPFRLHCYFFKDKDGKVHVNERKAHMRQ